MVLRKGSPKDRKYEFWTIFMSYLIYQDPSVPEKEKNLFGTLAFRMLSKAAEAVPLDSVRKSSPAVDLGIDFRVQHQLPNVENAIQSPEELSLLVRVYINTGHVREAKDVLMVNSNLGPQSAIYNLDHDLHRSLQLEVLQASQDWPAVIEKLRAATTQSLTEQFHVSRMLRILLDACDKEDHFE